MDRIEHTLDPQRRLGALLGAGRGRLGLLNDAIGGRRVEILRFQLAHTHAYAGCRVTLAGEDRGEDLVEFSDGVMVPCRPLREGPAIVLTIAPYTTARGTQIGEKTWLLVQDATRGDWKIRARR